MSRSDLKSSRIELSAATSRKFRYFDLMELIKPSGVFNGWLN